MDAAHKQPDTWGPNDGSDLHPPGGWALVFMAFMLTVAALAWGMFLIGQGQP